MLNKELERLQTVSRFINLKINKEQQLDEIVKMAAQICQTPIARITLIDADTQHIIFGFGSDQRRTSKKDAFCVYTIEQYKLMIVPDAKKDKRFINNPFVNGDPHIRFYAGAPLTTQDGYNLGTLCVVDLHPRQLSDIQQDMLGTLSRQIIQILEFEMSLKMLKEQYEEASNSETKLQSFFQSSRSCHLLIGNNYQVLAFNASLAEFIKKIFGASLKSGADIRAFINGSYLNDFIENYQTALTGRPITTEKELEDNNQKIWWFINYEPAYDSEGKITGVCFTATDITTTIKQKQLVMLQNDSLRKIAHMQSHELRRPVSSILGLMSLIKYEDYSATREDLIVMEKAVVELDEKIKIIVDYTWHKK